MQPLIDHQLSRNSPGTSELNFQPSILHLLRSLREVGEKEGRAGKAMRGKASLKTKYSEILFSNLGFYCCLFAFVKHRLLYLFLPSSPDEKLMQFKSENISTKKESFIKHMRFSQNLFSSSLDILAASLDTVV